jgi:hypothetical protein
MPSAAVLRRQIEHDLEVRFPAALTPAPRTIRECARTGIDAADRLLEGGLLVGAISEITGPSCSGRTSLALAFVAQRTAEGRICAWVDTHDALDPASAAANGVDLQRLLWVRCEDGRRAATPLAKAGKKPWTILDQALRATDLLLQAGGFAAIVLDLADTAVEHGSRIPLATWFRFRHAADRTRCSLVVLAKSANTQSSAALALECVPLGAEVAGSRVLTGFRYELQRGPQRFTPGLGGRKPPASTWSSKWSSSAAWETEKRA